MEFTATFLKKLEQETISVVAVCKELNNDNLFIQKINEGVKSNASKGLLFKSEHFFLSDCISIYRKLSEKETKKSQFTLAYYYDVLRNNHFAAAANLSEFDKLTVSPNFKNFLEKVKVENTISDSNLSSFTKILQENQNPKLVKVVQHFYNFLQFSFDTSFEKNEIVKQFFQSNSDKEQLPADDSLEKVLEELNELIGLDNIKKDVSELINLLEIQKKRTSEGLKNTEITLHTVFSGPPGTGKTSVARLLSRIFKHLGFLSKGQLIETDREGLIAGFVGQTALKVDKVVDESLGGVLFIDEAYALTQNSFGSDYGAEAVNTLIKRMEDHREDLALVVAGYTEPMKIFVESNPGLRSRFNRFFEFNHFSPSELLQIFESIATKSDFVITDDAKEKLNDTFELLYDKKDESFGNARVVRNLFEKCVQNQANRIIKIKKLSKKTLKTLTMEDIPEPLQTVQEISSTKDKLD
ncbi:AAA family ATPase [Flavobacterium nackdongense]|uniref:AAA family ATPase n=1 Tax=Flavobacterium nackdongense TaxID=2547394 RepID=A0A4P6YEU4_9FLAO|nr:AAA family ATPase [Flavobacterium nackdongense]QBN19325.1 AAA family ATPase [Flavobacterium nackdongense]